MYLADDGDEVASGDEVAVVPESFAYLFSSFPPFLTHRLLPARLPLH